MTEGEFRTQSAGTERGEVPVVANLDVRQVSAGCNPCSGGHPMSSPRERLLVEADDIQLALHRKLCGRKLATRRLGELVPLLKFIRFKVEKIAPEKTILSAPLHERPMNQNGTHQASVFDLLADYTLGVGMFAAMPGRYTVGVHDRCEAVPIQFWLRGGTVRHIRPGTGMLRAEAVIPPEDARELRRQLGERGRCVYRGKVVFRQGDDIVAEAEHEMGMYAESPVDLDATPDIIQTEKLKTSAIMISGLRDDPVSKSLAGEQGRAIAGRMSRSSPQLPDLVRARSLHLEDYLAREGKMHQQVVVLGAGLDAKPVLHASENQTWYLIDFDRMLRERSRVLDRHALANPFVRHVPADLRGDVWPERLKAAGYRPDLSTLFILEGVSMYLDRLDLDATISEVRKVCRSAASRLWLDHVTERLLTMPRPEVRKFLATMARLGEPFVTAFDHADEREKWDWTTVDRRTAAHVLNVDNDPIFDEYVFSLVAPMGATAGAHE